MTRKNSSKRLGSKGFSHVELTLLIVVIAVIAGVGFFVYSKNNNKSKADSIVADTSSISDLADISTIDSDATQVAKPEVTAPDVAQPELESTPASAANQRMARKAGKPNAAYGVEYDTTRSGYRLEGNGITARLNYVTGTVNVPTIYCTQEKSISASLVALDNLYEKNKATARAFVFSWCYNGEGYHSVAAQLDIGDKNIKFKDGLLKVKTGDKVSLEITRQNGKFVYGFKNLTTKRYNTFTATCSKNCETRDARWSVSKGDSKIPLTKASDRVFTNVKAGPDGWPVLGLSQYSMPPWKVVTSAMTDGGSRYLSVPSNPLGGDGQSFRVQFVNSK
jgi:type II secretory pathway pseudopilin PulG